MVFYFGITSCPHRPTPSRSCSRGHRGVSQEQVLLPLRRILRGERRRSLRGPSDLSRLRRQAPALWPSSEVRGQTGSTGAGGEEIQGQQHAG
ncbi:hypothetical protein INR49_001134 [Caranx melampygus]|nr:hypothetical protein INR49_001134 [Caranx melampygus]